MSFKILAGLASVLYIPSCPTYVSSFSSPSHGRAILRKYQCEKSNSLLLSSESGTEIKRSDEQKDLKIGDDVAVEEEDKDHEETVEDGTSLPASIEKEAEGESTLSGKSPLFNTISEVESVVEKDIEKKLSTDAFVSSDDSESWRATPSLGSFLLRRKTIEEEEVLKSEGDVSDIIGGSGDADDDNNGGVSTGITKGSADLKGVEKNLDETSQKVANDTESTVVPLDYEERVEDEISVIDRSPGIKKKKKLAILKSDGGDNKVDYRGMNQNLIKEVDDSVRIMQSSRDEIEKDIEDLLLPESGSVKGKDGYNDDSTTLPLGDERHIARIDIDMRRLAVSVASTIETEEEWKIFTDDGGGALPIFECIRAGAREVRQGAIDNISDEGMLSLVERQDAAFGAASSACKVLRDMCAISKPLSAVITDCILRADTVWAEPIQSETFPKRDEIKLSNGLISDLVTLLRYSTEGDRLYSLDQYTKGSKIFRGRGLKILRQRRQKKDDRKRCGLYVVQLLLAMSLASDKAVGRLRQTVDLTDAVLTSSSYAPTARLQRRWIKYPIEIIKRRFRSGSESLENSEDPFLTAASVGEGLNGKIHGTANQVLAAIGHNVWYPKTRGQKGLRILCLDGGGSRGITAISTMSSIVDALGGVEVCDAFDMIAGTSTGAIIAFLVGLRRESSAMARKRYDKLIKRVFVKSALSTPMLLFTTATYDEGPFNNVMNAILKDDSMLSSRSDPRVPLVFAIASKMSSTPTQLCLFRNYNYNGGEKDDSFVEDPILAKEAMDLSLEDDIYRFSGMLHYNVTSEAPQLPASRHPGSFRVLQRASMRATTAAPTIFKPVLMSGELYCDGGIVASNPAAVAIHEAKTVYPHVPIELVVSCGTGAFLEEKSDNRIGWDGIISQIVNSATDGEMTHHILEDILGQTSTSKLGFPMSKTKYYRFNPLIGHADSFPLDNTDADKLEDLSNIAKAYMNEPAQVAKLKEIAATLDRKRGWRRFTSIFK